MSFADVYQYSLERQTAKPALWCSLCFCEIYPQEEYYALDGRTVCRACVQECCLELFAPHRRFAPEVRG